MIRAAPFAIRHIRLANKRVRPAVGINLDEDGRSSLLRVPVRTFGKKSVKKADRPRRVYDPMEGATVERGDKNLQLVLDALNAPIVKEPEISKEEEARREAILKEFTIQRFNHHNNVNHDLSCKIGMKLHALEMLPKNSKIREDALAIADPDNEPEWMTPPTYKIPGSPPEEKGDGFDEFRFSSTF
mmetsp:Transcript_21889/g.28334  ORF Transcript_21889/g.28334 Transcript_21889/m.28334 type:complete len:186 (+) Transcript_21889:103-660(+)|eukprot:CAMPEP_0198145048 /NCGR_PEP_ID=MMETSP1443-20131203/20681_1 /TAXON_ID=186043 /ORGANISM="Entomoneis sp., Strain CCMP2396" /LENGTH=185 /DNA_ID=CAMNT_0043808563 /DNA_START=52 /DNA_END=609 /DNA_ORIENTATION=+